MSIKIRPGLLVSLSVRSRGGVTYDKRDIARSEEDGTDVATWETTRVIADREEHDRATKVRGLCRSTVAKVCTSSAFGLLCPEADEPGLDLAVAAARKLSAEFNETARHTQIGVYVLKGRVAATDAEAVAAIGDEVRGLLLEMERACKAADVDAIREAATRAKNLGEVLEGPTAYAVGEAVKAARAAARQIVKNAADASSGAERQLISLNLAPIEIARFMLTEDEERVVEGDALPQVDAQRFTGIDMAEGPDQQVELVVEVKPTGDVECAALALYREPMVF